MHRIDSRQISKGDSFYALRGERSDGHFFLEEAAARGAGEAVIEEGYDGPGHGLRLTRVPDPLEELQRRAREKLRRSGVRIVAVTGSVGKTTTKEFLKTLLAERFRVGSSPRNYNTQTGLPMTLLNEMSGDEELFVLEMGMTRPGQIARLVSIAPPEVAVVTEVAHVHACNFGSLNEIAEAKAEIFSHPATKTAVFPKRLKLKNYGCSVLYAEEAAQIIEGLKLSVPGEHNRSNLLAAAAAAKALGAEGEEVRRAVPKLTLPAGRFEVRDKKGVTLIYDAYNACLLSVKAALQSLPPAKRRIAVLGEMRELGEISEAHHREAGDYAQQFVDLMLCLGPACRPIVESWQAAGRRAALYTEREELTRALKKLLVPGDLVLIKGSRSLEMEKIADKL